MTLPYIAGHLNTHAKCIRFLEQKRWGGIPTCPYCNSHKFSSKKLRYTCLECKNSYSVTVGTFMENSNLPLHKWLMAISLMLAAKKGLSAMQLSLDIKVNKNTAWLLQMKIRSAMNEGKLELFKQRKRPGRTTKSQSFLSKELTKNDDILGQFQKSKTFGYWSLLKRAIIGQYHKIDPYYTPRYIDEINFKLNRKHLKDCGYLEIVDRLLFVALAK